MEYKEAVAILTKLVEKHTFESAEKEALMLAIGVLSWGKVYESRLKAQKEKRDQSAEW
ncbi:MAG: hypothetical protein WC958_02080 [Dehalococcoidales bacterium]